MQFKLQATALNEALDVVSIVPPRPVTAKGGSGFLFVVEGTTCRIYSRDALHHARVQVEVEEVDGEGSFIYPADGVSELRFLDGWIQFEAGHSEADDRHWVRYEAQGDAGMEFPSFDPRLMQSVDDSIDVPEIQVPVALFREALNMARGYLAKPNDGRVEDHFKTLQLFDDSKEAWAKGDGTLFAADGVRASYVFCDAFKGKGLSIHGQHLPFLLAFLSKCEGEVTIKLGDGTNFVVNSEGQMFGWAHHVKQHQKFSYYPRKMDGFVLKTDKALLTRALRHMRNALDKKRDKIRVIYSHEEKSLQFRVGGGGRQGRSILVGVNPVVEEIAEGVTAGSKGKTEDFAMNANVDHMLDLVEPMKVHEVSLRVAVVPAKAGRREAALFRTIEEFDLDAAGKLVVPEEGKETFQCRVTRFMPSKD